MVHLFNQKYGLVRFLVLILLTSSLALFTFSRASAQGKEPEAQKYLLDNGLTVIIKASPTDPIVALNCLVKAGSTTEGSYTGSGVSHFIEHMLFKGTEKRGVGQIARGVKALGGEIGGFTSFDYTGYGMVVSSRYFEEALEILCDALMNSSFDASEMEKEREVILNEIRLNRDDPGQRVSRLFWSTAFTTHPYHHPVIGYEELFLGLTREDLLNYYHLMYVPNNLVLTIVGDIDQSEAYFIVKEKFGKLKRGSLAPIVATLEPLQMSERRLIEEAEVGIAYLCLGFHGPAISDHDLYPIDVLAIILGQGKSSRLYRELKANKRLVHSITAWSHTPKDPGIFGINVLLDADNLEEAVDGILLEIDKVKKGRISKSELAKARRQVLSSYIFTKETVQGQAHQFAIDEVVTGDFNFSRRYIDGIGKVSANDIKRVAQKYLQVDNLTIVALIPKESAKAREEKEEVAIGFPIRKEELENGLVVLLKKDQTTPTVSIRAILKGGVRFEDEGKSGLSHLTAKMLLSGTTTKDAQKIFEEVESMGGSISTYSGKNSFGINLDLLSEDLTHGLDLLADCLVNPNFPEDQLELWKATTIAKIKSNEDDIFWVGQRTLAEELFKVHPYRFQPIGTEDSISKIEREDCLRFYGRYATSKNLVLAIFGDIDPEKTFKMITKLFRDLNSNPLPPLDIPKEPEPKEQRQALKYMEKEEALIMLGFHTIDIANEDRYGFDVITNILSGQGGRLFMGIREKLGLAYSVGSYHILGLDPGYYIVYCLTKPDEVERAKGLLTDEIENLRENGISTQELELAKKNLIGLQAIRLQTNGALAFQASLDELYGLGYKSYKDYPVKIDQVSEADIARIANRYFDLKTPAIVTVIPKN